ncbi:MAG: carbohydrate ABC transporter permease [Actinomycetota bacterium]
MAESATATSTRVKAREYPDPSRSRRTTKKALLYAILLALTIVYIAPLIWMVSTSLKTDAGAVQWPLQWFPEQVVTEGYQRIFDPGTEQPVIRWFFNSLLAACAHAALVLAVASPAAYALARMDFPGRRLIFGIIVGTIFIPPIVFIIPNFLIVDSFGMVDTLLAVIVPFAGGAFGVFFLRQFFLSLPEELEEAALVDGASRWQIFMRVVIPLSKPALATLGVLSFLANWNDLLWPVYVLLSAENQTLPPGLAALQGAYRLEYPVVMAGGVVASIPVLILFVIAQRYVVEGVARTGLKG